jgi:alkylhydroperoxidase family enzyme
VASFDAELIKKVLEDYKTAPINKRLRATLALIEKMTLDHGRLQPDDVRAALDAGVTREALLSALHVAYLFNIYVRLADAMGWHVPEVDSGFYESAARMLLKRGYL